MKRINEWLMDVGLRLVAPRLAVALLAALAGILADAGLLQDAVRDGLMAVLGAP